MLVFILFLFNYVTVFQVFSLTLCSWQAYYVGSILVYVLYDFAKVALWRSFTIFFFKLFHFFVLWCFLCFISIFCRTLFLKFLFSSNYQLPVFQKKKKANKNGPVIFKRQNLYKSFSCNLVSFLPANSVNHISFFSK